MPYSCLLQKEEGMVSIPVLCPHCHSDQVIKGGKTKADQASDPQDDLLFSIDPDARHRHRIVCESL
jgi:hypothetical protein